MIPVTVMVTGRGTVSTRLKGHYGRGRPSRFTDVLRPVVFWNITYQCNLKCAHCYIRALAEKSPDELSTSEAVRVAKEIAEIGSPLVIFSGGEPLLRRDLFEIASVFRGTRTRPALSTNGTLIDEVVANELKKAGFVYVGVSIDSINPVWHDEFRGVKGAFEAAIRGVRASVEAGIPTGLRTTITRENAKEVPRVLELAEELGAERLSYYILDTVGRGVGLREYLPTPEQLKWVADRLVEEAKKHENVEIEIVRANFVGIYLADKLASTKEEFMEYLAMLQGQGDCGRKTVSIYPNGEVRPCQFIDWVSLGNVKEQDLRHILRPDNPNLQPYLEIHKRLRGEKCGKCPFRYVCGGGSRSRARIVTGDEWGDDPACFIDPIEIARKWGLDPSKPILPEDLAPYMKS
ncbi:Radical SAM domain protein [Pyrolobus fumarii 1A]|uniref:Radical SAM domain protein n=1 Tax=Pyrolobus fumarii (strain DSM 11204 / 1A) TaxID=694429 RepID=G0EGR2_PYRF1|nr:radical SAM protein [Pyrolobus fumarii]AEM39210.1 Radical SAM domain protein [Pyrolobus fumarii 1A]